MIWKGEGNSSIIRINVDQEKAPQIMEYYKIKSNLQLIGKIGKL